MNFLNTLIVSTGLFFLNGQDVPKTNSEQDFEPSDIQIGKVQKEVVQFLRKKDEYLGRQENLTLVVLVNKDQELLVLDMNTKDEGVRKAVKERLNGQQVKNHQKGEVSTYICPLKLRFT